MTVSSVGGKVWLALNMFTEGLDFLQSLWEAIPKAKRHPPWLRKPDGSWDRIDWNDKLRDLYEHWEEIDPASAVANFINNEIEDRFYGQLGRATGKTSQKIGHLTGLNHAIREHQKRTDPTHDVDFLPQITELPEVYYDPYTDKFWLRMRAVN